MKRHIWLSLAVVAIVTVGGVIITLLMTPQYTATSRIEIAREQANVTNVEGLQRESSTNDQEFYLTQYSLLNARSLAERVERRLRLARKSEFLQHTVRRRRARGCSLPEIPAVPFRQRKCVSANAKRWNCCSRMFQSHRSAARRLSTSTTPVRRRNCRARSPMHGSANSSSRAWIADWHRPPTLAFIWNRACKVFAIASNSLNATS